jgi:hypothetical protein
MDNTLRSKAESASCRSDLEAEIPGGREQKPLTPKARGVTSKQTLRRTAGEYGIRTRGIESQRLSYISSRSSRGRSKNPVGIVLEVEVFKSTADKSASARSGVELVLVM